MIFAVLVAGDAVFVDANSVSCHFAPDPILGPPCSPLLQRIDNQELASFTSLPGARCPGNGAAPRVR